jgi:hypothetical protein
MAKTQISVEQYLMGRAKLEDLTPEQVGNINTLIPKINELLERYGKPVKMTSGYRSPADQQRINPKAPGSMHTRGAAIDLWTDDKSFTYWVLMHLDYLIELGLYIEDPSHTSKGLGGWIHCQIIPPRSGRRIFIP